MSKRKKRSHQARPRLPSQIAAAAAVARVPGLPPPPVSLRTAEARDAILAELRKGSTKSAAAGKGGMAYRTLLAWESEEPDFAEEVERARKQGEAALWEVHRDSAVVDKDRASIRWMLSVIDRKTYGAEREKTEVNVAAVASSGGLEAKALVRVKLERYLPPDDSEKGAG